MFKQPAFRKRCFFVVPGLPGSMQNPAPQARRQCHFFPAQALALAGVWQAGKLALQKSLQYRRVDITFATDRRSIAQLSRNRFDPLGNVSLGRRPMQFAQRRQGQDAARPGAIVLGGEPDAGCNDLRWLRIGFTGPGCLLLTVEQRTGHRVCAWQNSPMRKGQSSRPKPLFPTRPKVSRGFLLLARSGHSSDELLNNWNHSSAEDSLIRSTMVLPGSQSVAVSFWGYLWSMTVQ